MTLDAIEIAQPRILIAWPAPPACPASGQEHYIRPLPQLIPAEPPVKPWHYVTKYARRSIVSQLHSIYVAGKLMAALFSNSKLTY